MNKVLKVISTLVSGQRQTKCEACGDDFSCGASLKGCWCSEVKLTEEARAELRTTYSDCLCPNCLAKAADAPLADKQIR